jgi:uncharacterized repeat protein (TIGR03803 family)
MKHSVFGHGARALAIFTALAGFASSLAQAQTVSSLMYFNGTRPNGGVTLGPDGALYGAGSESVLGAGATGGLLYRVTTDAGVVSTIYQYGRLNVWTGAIPAAGLMRGTDNLFYGTTTLNGLDPRFGYPLGSGTVFSVDSTGQQYTRLYVFDDLTVDSRNYAVNATGADPRGQLIEGLEGGVRYLYGTTLRGGPDGTGTIFKVRVDGSGFQVLAPFAAATLISGTSDFDLNPHSRLKNLNGVNPDQRLMLGGDGFVYGVTTNGGPDGTGVVFRVSIAGGSITVLRSFSAVVPGDATLTPPTVDSNSDGAYPLGGLTLSGGMLYGTTTALGPNGVGNVFRMALDGTAFSIVHAFVTTDGAGPSGPLTIASDGLFLGTTQAGGTATSGTAGGTIYNLSPDGLTFNSLYVFDGASAYTKGATPVNGVVQASDGSVYGTTSQGTPYGLGTVYKFGAEVTRPPQGNPEPYNNGGAIEWWVIAALALLLASRKATREGVRE